MANKHEPSMITLVGSGAMGSLFAAFLAPQSDLAMISHWPDQIAAVRDRGLRCVHTDGSISTHRFTITSDARSLATIRLALFLVKSFQTARAALELGPVLAPDGLAVTLQNGLGNYEILQAHLGFGRVAQAVTAQGAAMRVPGEVQHAGHGPTVIVAPPGKETVVDDLVALLNTCGLQAQRADDLAGLQWGKLAVNAGINPLTAILRVPNGILLEHETARNLMCAAAEETAAVASALGIELPYQNAAQRVVEVAEATAQNTSSMLQDVLRGGPTEIDMINGAVAEHGRRVGVPTPLNDALWLLVRDTKALNVLAEEGTADAALRQILDQSKRE